MVSLMQLEGRTALVTGAGRGIGRAIALAYAKEGARVALAARSSGELALAVDEIRARGGEAAAFTADLTDRSVVAKLAADVEQRFGPVEILVNNSGVGSSSNPRAFVDFNDDFWDLSLAVNLTAPYLLSKAVLPKMLTAGWGRIITIASINSRRPSLHGCAYAASKHGVLGLMRTIALETAGDGVTVNCICPGPVRTLMNDKRLEYDAARLGRDLGGHERMQTPIGGRLEPEDISPMAVYLASDNAKMITGQAYNVDGGVLMS